MSRFAATVSLVFAFAAFHLAPDASAATRTFKVVADAYASHAHPATNYGSSKRVYVKGGRQADVAFTRFYLAGLRGKVMHAELRFYSAGAAANGPAVYRTTATWSESRLTWRNRPAALTGTSNDKGALNGGVWTSW